MVKNEEFLNSFFVEVFNKILTSEEAYINASKYSNLSVKEMHILEAVQGLKKEQKNTMGNVAAAIGITVSALTTAIDILIDKQYLLRQRAESDRRQVLISLTATGLQALKVHHKFHKNMVAGIIDRLNQNEYDILIFSLKELTLFFGQYLNSVK